MRTVVVSFVLVVCTVVSSSTAAAQAHPRRARALLLTSEAPAVLVASDRAWLPAGSPERPLSICAGERCRPVRSVDTCDAPRCPGPGTMVTTDGPIASVSDYPTGRDDFHRERDALLGDPVLAPYAHRFSGHPDPAPVPARWHRGDDEEVRWEASLAAGAALLAYEGIGTVDLVASAGARLVLDWGGGDDGDFLGIVLGNTLGIDVRVHVLPRIGGQIVDDFAVAVGVAPLLGFSPEDDVFRVPSLFDLLMPEFGVIARGDRDAAFYFAFEAPFAFLLDEHAAIELRASAMLIDDWVVGDDLEAILGLSAAIVVR